MLCKFVRAHLFVVMFVCVDLSYCKIFLLYVFMFAVDQKGLDSCGNDKYRTPENDDMPFWSSSPESKEDKQVTREVL